jgi:hypothetical protein
MALDERASRGVFESCSRSAKGSGSKRGGRDEGFRGSGRAGNAPAAGRRKNFARRRTAFKGAGGSVGETGCERESDATSG